MVTLPTYTVDVAWTGNLTGVFRIGISLLDGTDVLGNPFNGSVFDEITPYVYGFSTTRGRSDDLTEINQGTCSIKLRDFDGRFNPENPSSPLTGLLVPMRPIRIRATHNGITYGIFHGYIDRIEHDPLARESTIEAVDFFEILNNAQTETAITATTAGDIIEQVLDAIQFTDPNLRDIDTGRTVTYSSAERGLALTEVGNALVVDRGLFFATKDGGVRYISGENYWAVSTPVTSLDGDVNSEMRVATDKQRIFNDINVLSSVGGTANNYSVNTASKNKYGRRVADGINPVASLTSAQATNLGQWFVAIYGEPAVPSRQIAVKPKTDAVVVDMLGLEIGERVAFSEPRGGTNAEGIVEGINHTVEVGTLHVVQFLVSKRTLEAFTIGYSALNGTDILYY